MEAPMQFGSDTITQNQTAPYALGKAPNSAYTVTSNLPPPPVTPTGGAKVVPVVTAKDAIADLTTKQSNFSQINQGVATQAQNNLANQANIAATKTASDQIGTQANAEQAKADALNKATSTLNGSSDQYNSQGEQQIGLSQADISKRQDAAYNQYISDINSIRSGTFPLSASEEAQLNATQATYDKLASSQKMANQNYESGITQLGITSGRQRYAPEIQLGLVHEAVSKGISRIEDIEAKATEALSTLRAGFEKNDYDLINSSYQALTKNLEEKSKTISDINAEVRANAAQALEQHKQDYKEFADQLQIQLDNQKDIEKVMSQAAQFGADQETLDRIQNSSTVGEAIANSGDYLSAEFREKLQQQQFDNQVKLQQVALDRAQLAISQGNLALSQRKQALEEARMAGLVSADGQPSQELMAYAQQLAADGKIPTGLPEGTFGIISDIAKSLPKDKGTIVDKNTGIRSAAINDTRQEAISALFDIVNNKLPVLLKTYQNLDKSPLGKLGGSIHVTQDRQDFRTTRQEILNLLLKARSGAAVNDAEFNRYSDMMPTEVSLTGSTNKINSLYKDLNDTLGSQLNNTGLAIYGYSKVKLPDGKDYTAGDIIENGNQKARVNPDGTLTIVE